jgi:hypothetical protein
MIGVRKRGLYPGLFFRVGPATPSIKPNRGREVVVVVGGQRRVELKRPESLPRIKTFDFQKHQISYRLT